MTRLGLPIFGVLLVSVSSGQASLPRTVSLEVKGARVPVLAETLSDTLGVTFESDPKLNNDVVFVSVDNVLTSDLISRLETTLLARLVLRDGNYVFVPDPNARAAESKAAYDWRLNEITRRISSLGTSRLRLGRSRGQSSTVTLDYRKHLKPSDIASIKVNQSKVWSSVRNEGDYRLSSDFINDAAAKANEAGLPLDRITITVTRQNPTRYQFYLRAYTSIGGRVNHTRQLTIYPSTTSEGRALMGTSVEVDGSILSPNNQRKPAGVPEPGRSMLLNPLKYDPLSVVAGNSVSSLSEKSGKNVVALLSDQAIYMLRSDAASTLAFSSLDPYVTPVIDREWALLKPIDFEAVQDYRVDRVALASTVDILKQYGYMPVYETVKALNGKPSNTKFLASRYIGSLDPLQGQVMNSIVRLPDSTSDLIASIRQSEWATMMNGKQVPSLRLSVATRSKLPAARSVQSGLQQLSSQRQSRRTTSVNFNSAYALAIARRETYSLNARNNARELFVMSSPQGVGVSLANSEMGVGRANDDSIAVCDEFYAYQRRSIVLQLIQGNGALTIASLIEIPPVTNGQWVAKDQLPNVVTAAIERSYAQQKRNIARRNGGL